MAAPGVRKADPACPPPVDRGGFTFTFTPSCSVVHVLRASVRVCGVPCIKSAAVCVKTKTLAVPPALGF